MLIFIIFVLFVEVIWNFRVSLLVSLGEKFFFRTLFFFYLWLISFSVLKGDFSVRNIFGVIDSYF